MTSSRLVLPLLAQAQLPATAMSSPLAASTPLAQGAQAEVDLQHLFTGPPSQQGRYTLGLSAVQDWVYALAEGGTLLFPEEDGALRPGAFTSLGLGVDHAR